MDSITQAALGALCGEVLLSRKLGWKGAAWGLLFGTMPDLDIIGYAWLDAADQLRWHRGVSHSLFILPFASLLFGWILWLIHKEKKLSFKRAAWFVFAVWSTHILIDCFNTYGTQIFEPFNDFRFVLNLTFIIDPFFTVPMVLALIICVFYGKKRQRLRKVVHWAAVAWLCTYVMASVSIKLMAERHFAHQFNAWGVTPQSVMSSPTPFNIFCWRGVARDDEKYYITYWSIFDADDRQYKVLEFEHGHELEKDFKDAKEYQTVAWFTKGWRKTYTDKNEPNSIYMAPLMMGESKSEVNGELVRRPSFLWKVTKLEDGSYSFERPYKMSKDIWGRLSEVGDACKSLYRRAKGGEENYTEGKWIWDIHEQ